MIPEAENCHLFPKTSYYSSFLPTQNQHSKSKLGLKSVDKWPSRGYASLKQLHFTYILRCVFNWVTNLFLTYTLTYRRSVARIDHDSIEYYIRRRQQTGCRKLIFFNILYLLFWRAIERILTKRAPSWIQTRKRLEEIRKGVRPLFPNQHGGGSTRSRVYTAIIRERTENACTAGYFLPDNAIFYIIKFYFISKIHWLEKMLSQKLSLC